MSRYLRVVTGCLLVLGCVSQSQGGTIVSYVGDSMLGFNDGDFISPFVFDPFPYDSGTEGNEFLGPDFSVTWSHNFGPIADTITSASLTFGILDADSGAVGVSEADPTQEVTLADIQLDFFTAGTADVSLEAELLADGFEAGGQGGNGQYEEYTVALSNSLFADLATGTIAFDLGLVGPTFSPAVLIFLDDVVTINNGANMVFAELTIETQQDQVVPEPTSLAIFGVGALGCIFVRTRKNRLAGV